MVITEQNIQIVTVENKYLLFFFFASFKIVKMNTEMIIYTIWYETVRLWYLMIYWGQMSTDPSQNTSG